jgi:hypothetical protein
VANIKLTTADTSGFIPQYWAQRALDVLRNQIVALQFVARDSDFAEPGWRGKAITVGYPGTFTAVDKAADTPVTPQVPANGSSITLTLNKHKVVPFLVEDFAAAQANGSLMDRYIQPATIAIAEQVENDVLAPYTGFTGGTVGTSGTSLTSATVRAVDQQFNVLKAPMTDRILIVSPKDKASLLGDTALQSFFAFSQPTTVKNGVIGRLYGMDVAMSQLIPSGPQVGLSVTSGSLGGTYTLTFNGQTTTALAFNASAATVQAALVALSSVGTGNVVVSGTTPTVAGGALQVNFAGSLYGTTLPLTGSGASLTGTGAALTISTTTNNIAMHKNAVMFASRPFAPVPAGSGVSVAQANDPESGLSIRISAQYDVNNLGLRMNLDVLYGVQVLRANQGFIVAA